MIPMKALVTGGGGFLGRYIVEQLIDRGDSVRVLARGSYPELRAIGVHLVQGDIEIKDNVLDACRGVDIVFHTAAKVGVFGRYNDFYKSNVLGTRNIIESCLALGIQKLIFTSSSSVAYGGEDQINVDETIPYPKKYLSPYSETKAIAEKLVLGANGKNLCTASIRPHLIFGPRDKYIIPAILEKAKKGYLRIMGDGKNMTDISYVENCAEAHLMAADHLKNGSPVCGQAYYITQGKPVVLWEWVNRILREAGMPPVQKRISSKTAYALAAVFETMYRIFQIPWEPPLSRVIVRQLATTHTYNISKAKRDFGYVPKISTEEGLAKTFRYLKNLPGAF